MPSLCKSEWTEYDYSKGKVEHWKKCHVLLWKTIAHAHPQMQFFSSSSVNPELKICIPTAGGHWGERARHWDREWARVTVAGQVVVAVHLLWQYSAKNTWPFQGDLCMCGLSWFICRPSSAPNTLAFYIQMQPVACGFSLQSLITSSINGIWAVWFPHSAFKWWLCGFLPGNLFFHLFVTDGGKHFGNSSSIEGCSSSGNTTSLLSFTDPRRPVVRLSLYPIKFNELVCKICPDKRSTFISLEWRLQQKDYI